MQVLITHDKRGVSIWPAGTELQYDGEEWFDKKCETRGTNGLSDPESLERLLGKSLEIGEMAAIDVQPIWVEQAEGAKTNEHEEGAGNEPD